MKKYLLILTVAVAAIGQADAQSALDGYLMSQPDLKGTARFMSMGGAFGALGGDLTTLSYNPAGIGVYRNSDIGITLNFDIQRSNTDFQGLKTPDDQFKFPLNNAGYVGSIRLPGALKNFNWGFTYNKAASFNRRYAGTIPELPNSMSNYIAGVANSDGITVNDLTTTNTYDPYNPTDGGYISPWIAILGFDSYLITPVGNPNSPTWNGLYGNGTTGSGWMSRIETGGVDEYNISFGGNINNVVYWGMDFGITDLNYTAESWYGEQLDNAYIPAYSSGFSNGTADWDIYNYRHMDGTGFNYKLGVIVKPIQELRIGFAFHTPTWYNIDESFYADTKYQYDPRGDIRGTGAQVNNGYYGSNSYKFHTPWRLIASAAGVIGSNFIISADYEWQNYQGMSFSSRDNAYYWDGGYGNQNFYYYTNKDIDDYYRSTNAVRIGAEFRATDHLSLRAGYSNVSSPAKKEVKENEAIMFTAGTDSSYILDDETNYITCGLGYRYKGFYFDAAYVWKQRNSEWHAFTPDPENPGLGGAQGKICTTDNQIVVTAGIRF